MSSLVRTATLAFVLAGLSASAAVAAEPEILYPAKVMTKRGRIYHFQDLQSELARGSFVLYDGETEGRVPWRDVDKITFVSNVGHVTGAEGPEQRGARRVQLRYADGQERYVNLVIGKVRGFDGFGQREVDPEDLSVIDFDVTRIAPAQYKVCEHGHVWEHPDYAFCPYDGRQLTATRLR